MQSYDRIMSLVEEVREILDLREQDAPKFSKAHREKILGKIGKAGGDEKGHKATLKKIVKGHAAKTKHNPFKNLKKGKNLGPTSKTVAKIRGPSTVTPGRQRKVWRCRCNNYHCICRGKNAEGKTITKHVEISKAYKKVYNKNYKIWRKKYEKLFKAGGKRGFRAPAKPKHARYHAD